MYTDPRIVTTEDLTTRSYVTVYINGKRYRFYNGNLFDINCNPNLAHTISQRNRALHFLCYHLQKKLESGWRPEAQEIVKLKPVIARTAEETFKNTLKDLSGADLSPLYKRDIERVGDEFLCYLQEKNLLAVPDVELTSIIIKDFLNRYSHSGTYYMNKRRTLSAIFSRAELPQNPVALTATITEKATLHQAYLKDQLRKVLLFLEERHQNLYLCALLMYGCFLRPHQEVRSLFRRDLNSDLTSITLGGYDNKSGKIRTVFIPQYVREAMTQRGLHSADDNVNFFTGTCDVYNESYFNTAWSRIKPVLQQQKHLGDKHTLYSFRHTAAINLYMKTKDLYKVQMAMGHSSMTVTLTYMRSLGLINNLCADDAPDLW
jgi:integrase